MKALYAKLLLVQQELGAIKKEADNPFFHSKYFDINALIEHIKPLLNKHGLLLIQPLSFLNSYTTLKTILVDVESGEVLETETILPDGSEPQKMGSAITYFRRYAIQSLFLLEAEDDDGNSAKPAGTGYGSVTKAVPQAGTGGSGEWEYKTGISKKNNKPWWGKQRPGSKEMAWMTELEYAQEANGGKLTPIKPAEAQAMRNQPEFVDESYEEHGGYGAHYEELKRD